MSKLLSYLHESRGKICGDGTEQAMAQTDDEDDLTLDDDEMPEDAFDDFDDDDYAVWSAKKKKKKKSGKAKSGGRWRTQRKSRPVVTYEGMEKEDL